MGSIEATSERSAALSDGLDALEARIGYRFARRGRLATALVHRSAGGPRRRDNERLEFLGDRVLGLAVADLLYRRFEGEPEGGLSKRHAALVRRETLAEIAREWRLGPLLQLSPGERAAGGAANPATLGDAVEAIIGAVYEDGGYCPARDLVERFWAPRLEGLTHAPRDAKTTLQEWSQAQGLGLPIYHEVSREGPSHAPRFVVELSLPPHPPVRAEAGSKRHAEQAAAAAMLARLGEAPS